MDDSYSKEFHGHGDNWEDECLGKRSSSGPSSSEEIRNAVEECWSSSSNALDVSRKNIQHLTEEIYKVPDIKHFHLEGNVISAIPEDLFQKLPHLVWLDLRYNKIKTIPPGVGYHRQLKTLLLERNPIKELPTELGNLTSLRALNLRHCPLEFPPKDVIQKGLKSILCFLRNSGNGKLCVEPAASEKLHPSSVSGLPCLQTSPHLSIICESRSSLDLSDEWPNEEEKLRFQNLKEEIIKNEKEELLANQHFAVLHDFTEVGKIHRKKEQLYSRRMSTQREFPEFLSYDKMIQTKRAEVYRLAAAKELKEEQALTKQKKKQISNNAPYAMDNINNCVMKDGAEKQKDNTPEKSIKRFVESKRRCYKVSVKQRRLYSVLRASREKKLKQHIEQYTQMMKARKEKLKGKLQGEMKKAKQNTEIVENLQTKLAKLREGLCPQEYRFTAFTGEFSPDSERMKTQNTFFNMK